MPNSDPVSKFTRVLNVSADGRELTASGPIAPPGTDCDSVRVFAVVTQPPRECEPDPDDPDDPVAVTCRGEVFLSRQEMTASGTWSFQARTVGGLQFRTGWARASAILLEAQSDGDIETYSWSAWVWIRRP